MHTAQSVPSRAALGSRLAQERDGARSTARKEFGKVVANHRGGKSMSVAKLASIARISDTVIRMVEEGGLTQLTRQQYESILGALDLHGEGKKAAYSFLNQFIH